MSTFNSEQDQLLRIMSILQLNGDNEYKCVKLLALKGFLLFAPTPPPDVPTAAIVLCNLEDMFKMCFLRITDFQRISFFIFSLPPRLKLKLFYSGRRLYQTHTLGPILTIIFL